MKNRTVSMLLAGVLLCSAPAFAEGHRGWEGKENGEKRLEMLKEKLGLSDAQAAQIRAIKEQTATEMKAIKERTHQQIDAILTPEQREKFKAFREEMKGKKEGWMKNHKECKDCKKN